MKKIKITKEQYNKIAKYLTENANIPTVPNMGKLVDKSFKKAFTGKDIKNLKEDGVGTDFKIEKPVSKMSKSIQGKFMKESVGDLKRETLELIKYLYRKSEEFSPFWAEHDLTYDDICDALESKGMIIKKDGRYELSKSLGSAEEAKKALEVELSNMVGGELNEYDNYSYPMGADADPNAPWNQKDPSYSKASINTNKLAFEGLFANGEIAILKDKSGALYALYYDNVPNEELDSIAYDLGFAEEEYVGKDEDGMPDIEYSYNWRGEDEEKDVVAAYADGIANEAGEGLSDWEEGVELVKIDDTLKNELLNVYDKDNKLTSILSGVNEMELDDIKQKLGEPFKQQPTGYEEKSPEEKERIRQNLAAIRARSQAQDIERFKQRDLQNATSKDVTSRTLPVEPKKPIGQYNMFGGIDEMGTAGAMGGGTTTGSVFGTPSNAPVGKFGEPLKRTFKESMEASPSTTGEYTAPAFKMKKNHTDFAETNPKAFQKTQWADGSFVEFDDCVKPNNNKKAQQGGCSAGAVDGVVKQRKSKGNINAPSLNEVYKAVAEKTGKTIEEVKAIIESKKNKG